MPALPKLPQAEYVYIIQDAENTGLCKIGRSSNPVRRMSEFGIQLPFEIAIVRFIPTKNASQLESSLHRRFAEKRRNGEWFDLNEADLLYLMHIEGGLYKSINPIPFAQVFSSRPNMDGFSTWNGYGDGNWQHRHYIYSNTSQHHVWVGYNQVEKRVDIFWSQSSGLFMFDPDLKTRLPSNLTEARTMQRMLNYAISIAEKIEKIYAKESVE